MVTDKNEYPPLLLEVFDIISSNLSKNGIDEKLSNDTAIEVTEALSTHWKGSNIYIPGACQFKKNQRDREIMELFDGKNYTELGLKFGISTVMVRKIIKKMRHTK